MKCSPYRANKQIPSGPLLSILAQYRERRRGGWHAARGSLGQERLCGDHSVGEPCFATRSNCKWYCSHVLLTRICKRTSLPVVVVERRVSSSTYSSSKRTNVSTIAYASSMLRRPVIHIARTYSSCATVINADYITMHRNSLVIRLHYRSLS